MLFFGALGGFVGWLSLKRPDRDRADHVLKWGFIWSGVGLALSILFYALVFAALFSASH